MVERRLPKPKVAGSNPVFRSIKFPQNHRPQHPTAVFFFILPPAPEQKTTLTDIPNENKIPHLPKVCIFPAISPHLPKVSFRTMSTRASVAAFCLHSAFPHLPKVSRNTRKSTHLPKVEQQQSLYSPSKGGTATKPPTPNISLLSARFRTFAALWQTIISKEDTTNTWNGRPQPRKRSVQPGRSGWTPTGSK